MSHPAVQAYKDNKATFDANYFLAHVKGSAERNPQIAALRETAEYRAFIALCSDPVPFGEIIRNLREYSIGDLNWLTDNMPSGFARARVMDLLHAREAQAKQ